MECELCKVLGNKHFKKADSPHGREIQKVFVKN